MLHNSSISRALSMVSTHMRAGNTSSTIQSLVYRRNSDTSAVKPKTAVVMLNMGGPPNLDYVGPFLNNLFSDPMIIDLGKLQSVGRWAAQRRTPKIQEQYAAIGGGSPIGKWTKLQGDEMCKLLDERSPETAPHKAYTMFRYAPPLTGDVIADMHRDGVTRAVAFSQYPMYSCTTSGASLTHLWAESARAESDIKWSVIDRWYDHPGFISAVARRVAMGIAQLPEDRRDSAVIVFSAHSLPMKVVAKGDPYSTEVAHSVELVMKELGVKNPHILSWQSKVGYLPWLVPSTADTLDKIGKQTDSIVVVPIAFTSDHIETLYEIDIELAESAKKAGIVNFARAPSLNDEPLLIEAQADIVMKHLQSGAKPSKQYPLHCLDCKNPLCRTVYNQAQ